MAGIVGDVVWIVYVVVVVRYTVGFFFFFKQKTAYEIGTGDWSSDVCSSDLPEPGYDFEKGKLSLFL